MVCYHHDSRGNYNGWSLVYDADGVSRYISIVAKLFKFLIAKPNRKNVVKYMFAGYVIFLFESVLILFFPITLWWRLFRKGSITPRVNARLMKEKYPFYFKNHKKVDIVFLILVTVFCTFVLIWNSVPLIRDIPYYISKEYKVVEGYAMTQAVGMGEGRESDFTLIVQDIETGEEVELLCYSTKVRKGDYIKAYYLPNSHAADIVEQVSSD